jgi:hypothetical protein
MVSIPVKLFTATEAEMLGREAGYQPIWKSITK